MDVDNKSSTELTIANEMYKQNIARHEKRDKHRNTKSI